MPLNIIIALVFSSGLIGGLIAIGAAFQRLKDHAEQIQELKDKIEVLEKNNITIAEIKKDVQQVQEKLVDLKLVFKEGFEEIREALGLNVRTKRSH